MTDRLVFTAEGATLRIRVFVQPRSSRPGIAGRHGDALKVRVAAPPEGGRANEEVVRLVARELGAPLRSVVVASGHSSRSKTVEVECPDAATASARAARLADLAGR